MSCEATPRLRCGKGVGTSCIFLNDTSAALHVIAKRSPFAFQKGSFCVVEGLLLLSKTNPFAVQKDSFWKPGGKGAYLKDSFLFKYYNNTDL